MKRTFALLFILSSIALGSGLSFADGTNTTSGVIDLKGLRASEVLPLYQNLCGHKLVVDSRVKMVVWPITLHISGPLKTREELLKQFRAAFLKQAGVVISPLDDGRESVTCNDALPISH